MESHHINLFFAGYLFAQGTYMIGELPAFIVVMFFLTAMLNFFVFLTIQKYHAK